MMIPASQYVTVVPSVESAGGDGLDLIGLILTTSTRAPIGTVPSFVGLAAVQAYFGPSSPEAAAAEVYFLGFDNSNIKPGALLFAQYPAAAVSAYLRGGNASGMTLAQLQALSGVLAINVNGTLYTSSNINLSSATSFSSAASLIQAGFTSPPFTVSFDSVSGGFVITSTTAGADSVIAFPTTGALATGLLLTQATGAVLSQGAAATTPTAFMPGIVAVTTNWVSFCTLFNPDTTGNANKLAFAAWTNGTGNRYAYVCWDTDITATQSGTTTHLGYLLDAAQYSGTILIYEPADEYQAPMVMGFIASIDFTEIAGRTTLAYLTQTGMTPLVVSGSVAANLEANGYNYYGAVATANQGFQFLFPGQISGPFNFVDSYVNEIWMNNQFQLTLVELLTVVKSIPYAAAGYALVEAALLDPINAAVSFGAVVPGVTLSSTQKAAVNRDAGVAIDQAIYSQGWYLQVRDATAQVRSMRQSPPISFWYSDGQSIQRISMSSVEVA